ncbi:MAG: zinc metallopeptidase [Bacteroidetes bacterium]|jgi:Zn-dependent membrane protease YugP|nr:zinc metallopeptidase [Bacteroidota bacterium]
MSGYFLITIVMMLISMAVQQRLKSKFNKYRNLHLSNRLSGREIAEKMLRDHGIVGVKIEQVDGELTDHYNPVNRTVNLSRDVYYGENAAAAAVAAHECGHAVQHANAYSMLQLRSKLVPLQNISATILNVVIFGAAFIGFGVGGGTQLVLGIILACYAVITLFALVTLPVEFDASNRALAWMKNQNMVSQTELDGARDSLKWAAMTYVAAAAGALVNLLYFLLQFLGASKDE